MKNKGKINDLKEFKSTLDRSKVYDQGIADLFGPKRIFKSAVCEELIVDGSEVNCDLELFNEDRIQDVDEERYPFVHIGCIGLGFMGLGRNLKGRYIAVLTDTRLKGSAGEVSRFVFNVSEGVSAFVDFPNYCISTLDIKAGFTLNLRIISEGLEFADGSHPLAMNVVGMCRFLDETLETKMLVKKVGAHMYQSLCNSEFLDPRVGSVRVTERNECEESETMLDVIRAIKLINGKSEDKAGSENSSRS